MSPHRPPARTRFGRWWRSYAGAVAFVSVIVVGVLGFAANEGRIDEVEAERVNRSRVQAEINRYVCTENNKQDRILAGLLEVSLAGAEDRPLTPQQEAVRAVFLRALRELHAETPCNEVVLAFLEASETQDYEAIRRVLRSQR